MDGFSSKSQTHLNCLHKIKTSHDERKKSNMTGIQLCQYIFFACLLLLLLHVIYKALQNVRNVTQR